MAEEKRSDLKMLGTNNSSGGHFRHVTVTGESKFTGDVDCLKLSLVGELVLNGNLYADEMKITGECTVEGSVEGTSLKGQGELRTTSSLKMERIKLSGSLTVKGNCESENLHLSGAIQVEDLLNAEQMEIGLYGPSRAREVGGGTIVIKRTAGARLIGLMKPRQDAYFATELIEGDFVDIQYTKAGIVRGKQVIIGPECEINTVEYADTLEVHKSAKVKHQVKV